MKNLLFILACVLVSCGTPRQPAAQDEQTTDTMNADTIVLETPRDNGATIYEALAKRVSVREYSDRPLTLPQLSGVLWAAAGQTRPDGKLTAPSALALYPIKVYAVLPNGIYLYGSREHTLTLVKGGDFRELAGLQDFVRTAPLNIMYIADLNAYAERLADMPEADKLRLASLDAAGYCENANLYAAANGMGSVTRGGARGAEFLEAIGAPASCRFVLAQTVGIPR